MPVPTTTVWSGSARSTSIGTTVTCVRASGRSGRGGKLSWRNSGFIEAGLGLVLPGLPPHGLGVELVELVDQFVGHELLDVHLGLESGGLAFRGGGHELLQALPAAHVVQPVLAGPARLH